MAHRKPTDKEQADAWKTLAFQLNMQRTIAMNNAAIIAILDRIDRFVGAHGDHNGERRETEIQANVNNAFWAHIANAVPPPLPTRGRPKKS